MSTRFVTTALSILLSVSFIVPTAFFSAPQKVYAQIPTAVVADPGWAAGSITAARTTFSAIKEYLIEIHSFTTAVAEWAQYINTYVLQPLAFVLSGNLMKQLTASVIQFVVGKANSTGVPQFVVDVQRSTRDVADGQALAYLKNVNKTKSPFSGSIAKALSTDYLTRSSLKGFWESNMNSLDKASPNVTSYLRGSWSQGGVSAWFSLTTQTQNNPFSLYQNAQNKLDVHVGPGVGGVTGKRTSEIGWGSGFMSWCGDLSTEVAANVAENDAVFSGYTTATDCLNGGGDWNTASNSCVSPSGPTGVNPGDTCVDKNGNQGTIKTPGSVIKATLDKVLGGQQDEIVRMGNIGPEINGILSDIGTVMKTVMFASDILGGATGSNGGLLSAGNPASSNGQRLAQFMPTQNSAGDFTSGYIGASKASITANTLSQPTGDAANAPSNTNTSSSTPGTAMGARVKSYEDSWISISSAANIASTSVSSLADTCATSANTAAQQLITAGTYPYGTPLENVHSTFIDAARTQGFVATTVKAYDIAPVLVEAAKVPAIVAAALAFDEQVSAEAKSGSTSYLADSLKLQDMPPTSAEISQAQQNALSLNAAVANPPGSLAISPTSISGSPVTTVDKLMLISANAKELQKTVCAPPTIFSWPGF